MNKKILTAFLIVFFMFVVFSLNEVFAVGMVSQAWTEDVDGDGKADLIFRTYTTPHSSTTETYHGTQGSSTVEGGIWSYTYDGKSYISKWIDTSSSGFELPSATTFRTLGFAFHTNPIGSYTAASEEGERLSTNIGYNAPANEIGKWIDTISKAYKDSSVVYTTPSVARTYDSVVFYELMRGNASYSNITWGTGLKATNIVNNKKTQLRYCIVNINGSNVYVADNVVYGDDLASLVKGAKDAGVGLHFYVSDIIISKTKHSSGGYEVSKTASDFFYKQYDKQKISWKNNKGQTVTDWYWSKSSRGRSDNKAMGSVANLYDNELIVPQTSKRTVLVRHINVGMNTTISTSIVKNSTRIASTNLSFTASNPTETIWGSNTSSTYSGYEEYYEKVIDIDRGVTKVANANTSTYKCIGYNIAVSTDLGQAQDSIKTQIKNGKFTKGTTATAAAKEVTSDSDYVVIDFYYTEYEKDVYVNHLFVDKNGYVKEMNKQTIVPNETATMANNTIYRTNTDKYRSEVYEKRLGYNVYTRTADSVSNDATIEYKGYEVFTSKTNASSLIGTQRTDLNTSTKATLTSSNIQVNFYYYYETKVGEVEPEKDIGGTVFVTAANNTNTTTNISTVCNDSEEQINITSIPSGTNAKVGITGIPRYMVGAITTEYVSPINSEHSMNLSLTFKMGTQTKTIDFDTIKYRVGYYKVTDMAVYKLKNMTIYDADKGYTGTVGASLFDWKNGQLNLTPNKMNLNVQLTGINGRTIANKASAINNINNYVAVSIEDKNGRVSSTGTANSDLSRVYLTVDQLAEVDANSDGAVTSADKTYADNKLKEYNTILTNKKNNQTAKQTAYDNAVKTRATLLSNLNAAIKERDRLYDVYQELEAEKTEKLRNIGNAEADIKILKETTLPNLTAELETLKQVESEKLAAKGTAEENLRLATAEKDRLNTIYLDSITLRNELAAKANCNDIVDEDVYIYLEQEEKDALEQCKLDKEAYAKNLEDQVVENAQKAYEDYLENEWNEASAAVQTATNEYNMAVTNRQNKEKEISTTNSTIVQKEEVLEIMERDYETFIKEEYSPAKKAYETYRDVTVPNAQKAYDSNINNKTVENALAALNTAKDEVEKAQSNYDKYNTYRNNLYSKYNSYKALYDEFIGLTKASAAATLGLKLNVFVQNMTVKVNGTVLTTASSNTAQGTYNISSLIKNGTVPQVYTERPVISTDVYSNIGSTLMTKSDFTNSNSIDKEKLNGVSVLSGKAEYEAQVVIGSKSVSEIEDTIYYSDQSSDEKTVIFKLKNNKITKTYRVNTKAASSTEKYAETTPINIYTPITVSAKLESDTNQIINQTANEDMEDVIIQINTPFTINLGNDEKPGGYNINNTKKFSGGYYVKFDFDVHKVKINGKTYKSGNRIEAGTWIGIIPDRGEEKTYISAQAYGNLESDALDVVTEENSSYTVRAVAYNATDIMLSRSTRFASIGSMTSDTSELKDIVDNICKNPSYFAEKTYDAIIVNRAYDFRVTDVKDVNWKSVFRTTTSSNTNAHRGIAYYSGTTKWNTKSEKTNDIIARTSSEIGRNPQRILPIGPYKSTTSTYIKSPKMGYRFSFDMKVTGSYYETKVVGGKTTVVVKENKKVAIGTKFYYISKDGKTYLPEYDGKNTGIYLFYKTSDGKYVRIDENGGGYTLRFTPNDGYRYIEDSNTSTLSSTSVVLGNLRNLTLTYNMATVSNNGAVITYYGEYKLPNSTIAVKVNSDGTYDINKPLKDGYIGVVFDIVAYAGNAKIGNTTQSVLLSYSKDTKSNQPNTSQWDYEGFLGYTDSGNKVQDNNPIKMKLEKGTWSITNDIYNEIKGSVMLYDLDERAATDYE